MLVKEFNKDTKTYFAIECQRRLFKKKSKHQKIEIYMSKYYGNILLLDNCFMLTEKNSNQYKDTCVNIIGKKKLDNILIIGGGDFEITKQLRNQAGKMQREDARIGLAENAGGWIGNDVAATCVTILSS